MNKRERVMNALNCQSVDRPPVGFWFHFPEDKALGQACIDAHLNYYNNVDVDLAKIIEMAERGALGKLIEVESADGDIVEVVVE